VNGNVTFVNIKNNSEVKKGDILLGLSLETLDTTKAINRELSSTVQNQVHDYILALLVKSNTVKMANDKLRTHITYYSMFLTSIISSLLFN
jgi:multidrug resistance efflux pump